MTDVHARELNDLLSRHSLQQHVTSPTHEHDQTIAMLPVDPLLLSDHHNRGLMDMTVNDYDLVKGNGCWK